MRQVWLVVLIAAAVGAVIDLAVGSIPLWTAATGFGGSILLILVAKALGTRLLKRPESYYGEEHG